MKMLLERFRKLFFFFSIIYWQPTFSQIFSYDTTFHISKGNYTDSINLKGFLDHENTFSEINNIANFFPVKSIEIKNAGNQSVKNPKIIFNNRGDWYSHNSIYNEIINPDYSDKEKILSAFKFIQNNRVHWSPAQADGEINILNNLLGVYGYGFCDDVASALCGIFNTPKSFTAHLNGHVAALVYLNYNYYYVDSDIEVFYLNMDNKRIASYTDILKDKYLIKRTHHYGKSTGFSLNTNSSMADRMDEYAKLLNWSDPQKVLNYTLRPGESIIFSNDTAKLVHHIYLTVPDEKMMNYVVGNGIFKFKPTLLDKDIDNLFYSHSNLILDETNSEAKLHSESLQPSEFSIQNISPFVILGGYIKFRYLCNSSSDSIALYYRNSVDTWLKIWKSSRVGIAEDSININEYINPLQSTAQYSNQFKFRLYPKKDVRQCGISSFEVATLFQHSKYFVPQLKLGKNLIEYSDLNEHRNVSMKICWEENFSNTPPTMASTPIFPNNQQNIDSVNFAFKWKSANDSDGDDIVDYHFQLSDRPDMKFPLAPNFDRITSRSPLNTLESFQPEITSFYNDQTKYYWRVRAQDARGTWSDWSPTWSFTARMVKRPVDLVITLKSNRGSITWDDEEKGIEPTYYKIYASDEPNGFFPTEETYLGTCQNREFSFSLSNNNNLKTYYRIIAFHHSRESKPSECINIPKKQKYSPIDIYPNPVLHTGFFKFKNQDNNSFTLNIFDVNGINLRNLKGIENDYCIINLEDLKPGIYIITITNTLSGKKDSAYFIKSI